MQNPIVESFPIRAVSEITGVNAVTLRAWERRYGLIKPVRTPKGHRVYTRDDIEQIREILERLATGASIGQVARDIRSKPDDAQAEADNIWTRYSQRMIDAIARFDENVLDSVYNDAMSLYPVDIVTSRLLMPLLEELGSRWETATGSVAEEHFFSVYLRNKLGARFHHQNLKNTGPRLIVACLPGEQHEFGILLFALMAHSKGYQIILLGANLPVAELPHVAEITGSGAVVLSGSAPLGCDALVESIGRLSNTLSIPVFIGGGISRLCRDQIFDSGAFALGPDLAEGLRIISNTFKNTNRHSRGE